MLDHELNIYQSGPTFYLHFRAVSMRKLRTDNPLSQGAGVHGIIEGQDFRRVVGVGGTAAARISLQMGEHVITGAWASRNPWNMEEFGRYTKLIVKENPQSFIKVGKATHKPYCKSAADIKMEI